MVIEGCKGGESFRSTTWTGFPPQSCPAKQICPRVGQGSPVPDKIGGHTSEGPPVCPLHPTPWGSTLKRTQNVLPRKPRRRIQFNFSQGAPGGGRCFLLRDSGGQPSLPLEAPLASKVSKHFPRIGCQNGTPLRATWPRASSGTTFPLPTSQTDPLAPLHTRLPTWPFFPERGRGFSEELLKHFPDLRSLSFRACLSPPHPPLLL